MLRILYLTVVNFDNRNIRYSGYKMLLILPSPFVQSEQRGFLFPTKTRHPLYCSAQPNYEISSPFRSNKYNFYPHLWLKNCLTSKLIFWLTQKRNPDILKSCTKMLIEISRTDNVKFKEHFFFRRVSSHYIDRQTTMWRRWRKNFLKSVKQTYREISGERLDSRSSDTYTSNEKYPSLSSLPIFIIFLRNSKYGESTVLYQNFKLSRLIIFFYFLQHSLSSFKYHNFNTANYNA